MKYLIQTYFSILLMLVLAMIFIPSEYQSLEREVWHCMGTCKDHPNGYYVSYILSDNGFVSLGQITTAWAAIGLFNIITISYTKIFS